MDFGLNGRVAIVTGGASGIGRGISEALASCGVKVLLTYFSSDEGASATVAAIKAAGGEAHAIRADLTEPGEAKRVVDAALNRFGHLHILVANSGGLLERSSIVDCSLELWNKAIAVNLTSTFLMCQAALPVIANEQDGSIITVGSLAAHDGGGAGSTHYAVSKGGVMTFTKALAKEAGPQGVRANSVAPGLIGTQFHDRFSTLEGRALTVERTPLGREGTPEDVAGAVVFLASPRSGFITGETIEVNGGQGVY